MDALGLLEIAEEVSIELCVDEDRTKLELVDNPGSDTLELIVAPKIELELVVGPDEDAELLDT